MNPRLSPFILAAFVSTLLGACATAPLPPTDLADEDVAKLLVGKWDLSTSEGMRRVVGFDHFEAGGRFAAEVTTSLGANKDRVATVRGSWKVADGNIVETIQESDPPVHAPGTVYRLKVVSITADSLVTEGAAGVVVTRKRLR